MSGIFYFWKSHTATISGSITRHECCVGCSCLFEYRITRTATGGGHSPLFLNRAGAEAAAKLRARANLSRSLNDAIEPVHCPACGIFQPEMEQALRERRGGKYEPNMYAAERIAVPVEDAWRAAYTANTKDSYTKFMEVWPAFSSYAEERIKELRYPPYLRKLVFGLFWVMWGALVLFMIVAIFVGSHNL